MSTTDISLFCSLTSVPSSEKLLWLWVKIEGQRKMEIDGHKMVLICNIVQYNWKCFSDAAFVKVFKISSHFHKITHIFLITFVGVFKIYFIFIFPSYADTALQPSRLFRCADSFMFLLCLKISADWLWEWCANGCIIVKSNQFG